MTFKDIFIGFALISLFIFGMVMFATQIALRNNAPYTISDDPQIQKSFGNLSSQLNTTQSRSEGQLTGFEAENPQESFGSLLLFNIISAGKTFRTMITGTYDITLGLIFNTIFGGDSQFGVAVGLISSILILLIIIFLWRIYRAGE